MPIRCPYCLEQVDDNAVVCSHCGHDWMLVKPLLMQMVSLEKDVADLSGKVQDLSTRLNSVVPVMRPRISFWRQCPMGVSALALAVALAIVFGKFVDDSVSRWLIYTCAIVPFLSPFPFGFWAGLSWPGSHIVKYTLWGGVIGLGYALTRIAGEAQGHIQDLTQVRYILYVVGAALSFVAGGVLGDWRERTRDPAKVTAGMAGRIARCLIDRGTQSEKDWEGRIQKLSAVLNALVPILTTLGTIIVGIAAAYIDAKYGHGK